MRGCLPAVARRREGGFESLGGHACSSLGEGRRPGGLSADERGTARTHFSPVALKATAERARQPGVFELGPEEGGVEVRWAELVTADAEHRSRAELVTQGFLPR